MSEPLAAEFPVFSQRPESAQRLAAVLNYSGQRKNIMIKGLSILILAAILLAGCAPFESVPQQQTTQQTTTTTTTSCPDGTTLQSDGMCR